MSNLLKLFMNFIVNVKLFKNCNFIFFCNTVVFAYNTYNSYNNSPGIAISNNVFGFPSNAN